MANHHWNGGDVELSLKIAKFSIINFPNNLASIILLLKFHDRTGNLNKFPSPRVALRLSPQNGLALLYKRKYEAQRLMHNGQLDQAARIFRTIEKILPHEVTDAWLKTPFQAPSVAPILRGSKTILRLITGGAPTDIDIYRYVCRMDNAIYDPKSLGLLSKDRQVVINACPLKVGLRLSDIAFGQTRTILPDKRLRLHYKAPSHAVKGTAICLYLGQTPLGYGRGWHGFILDAVLGAHRVQRLLNTSLPVLIPDNLDDRRRAFLGLAGVEDSDMIPVPAAATISVEAAVIPSRSYMRDARVWTGASWQDLRMLFEPESIISFNADIQARFGGGAPRRLYLSRNDAPGRRIINEDAVMGALSGLGFVRLTLAEMPFEDLVSAFANAEIIVSPHGTGITNTLFAPRAARVIEIDHPRNDFNAYGISRALGRKFVTFGAIPDARRVRSSSDSQTVDVSALVAVVEEQILELESGVPNLGKRPLEQD